MMLAALTLSLALVTPAATAQNEPEAYPNNVERRINGAKPVSNLYL